MNKIKIISPKNLWLPILDSVLLGAGGVLVEIQDSINIIWRLKAKLKKGLTKIVINRLISFSMIISFGLSVFAALLFLLGKLAIDFYLGSSINASVYVVAGPLIVIIGWVLYSSIILLYGAEFTQVQAKRYGTEIQPYDQAVLY